MKFVDPRSMLREAGLHPKKSFGQNFLVAEHVIRAIATACVPDAEMGRATVLELGAGTGALTAALVERALRVVAVERDRDLVPLLERALSEPIAAGVLRVLEGDAQRVEIGDARVLCGNLPYQITGALLERAVHAAPSLDRAVFMVQEEVADRLLASPGTKTYGALTVFTRAAFDVDRVLTVSRGCFHPAPEVTSAVVRMTPRRPPRAEETETFRSLVRGAFGTRRKTLRNAWSKVAPAARIARAAETAGISLDLRGETLDVEAYARMAAALDSDREE